MTIKVKKSLRKEVKKLIQLETQLLNETRLDEWISLFTEDGFYWMPLEVGHEDPEAHDSLIYDNRALMEMRKHNLGNRLSPSMQRSVRSVRIISELDIVGCLENEVTVNASVIAVINHRQQDFFAGGLTYKLLRTNDGLKIKMKRVDLLNADAPLDIIMMYI